MGLVHVSILCQRFIGEVLEMWRVFNLLVLGIFTSLVNGTPLRIFGGADAPEGFAPHMAGLTIGEAVKIFVCGASIISTRHLLTAAHCVDSVLNKERVMVSSLQGVVGSNQWNSTKNNIKFSGYINHPSWDDVNIKNDIGVLFITQELEMDARVGVVKLNFDMVVEEDSYVCGWGRIDGVKIEDDIMTFNPNPDTLQFLDVRTISHARCFDEMHAISLVNGHIPEIDDTSEICTFHSYGHGMCHGDSGSALVSSISGEQIGIVSWGFPCAIGAPDVFTRISAFKDFLQPIILKGN